MISAIIYNSTTGSCEKYAREMSRKLAIPCYPASKNPLPAGMEIVYIGCLMNGKVAGLAKARKDYDVKAVVQVGMGAPYASAEATCREKNDLGSGIAVFTMQGAFNMARLPLPMQLIMKVVNKDIVKKLEAKKAKSGLTAAEEATLTMASTGKGEPATWDDIQVAVDWVVKQFDPPEVIKWHEPT